MRLGEVAKGLSSLGDSRLRERWVKAGQLAALRRNRRSPRSIRACEERGFHPWELYPEEDRGDGTKGVMHCKTCGVTADVMAELRGQQRRDERFAAFVQEWKAAEAKRRAVERKVSA